MTRTTSTGPTYEIPKTTIQLAAALYGLLVVSVGSSVLLDIYRPRVPHQCVGSYRAPFMDGILNTALTQMAPSGQAFEEIAPPSRGGTEIDYGQPRHKGRR